MVTAVTDTEGRVVPVATDTPVVVVDVETSHVALSAPPVLGPVTVANVSVGSLPKVGLTWEVLLVSHLF